MREENAQSMDAGLGREQKACFDKQLCLYLLFYHYLILFSCPPIAAQFSYVSIAKDRAKPHRVKKQFPTSCQRHKCIAANVGREKGAVGVCGGAREQIRG